MVSTEPVFHEPIGVLKKLLPRNRSLISLTAETSHVFMSAQPIPGHLLIASTREVLVVNTVAADNR